MKRPHFVLGLICMGVLLGTGMARALTSDEVLRLAPRIALDEEAITSFRIKGYAEMHQLTMRFEAAGQDPESLSLLMVDGHDGTPIIVGRGRRVAIYDPLAAEVMLAEADALLHLHVRKKKDAKPDDPDAQMLWLGFGMRGVLKPKDPKAPALSRPLPAKPRDPDKPQTTLIDLKSIFTSLDQPLTITQQEGTRFLVTGKTVRGSRCVAQVDLSRKEGAFQRIELYNVQSGDKPFLVLEEIAINVPVGKEAFEFPEEDLVSSDLRVRLVGAQSVAGMVGDAAKSFRALAVRRVMAGAGDDELKGMVERMVGRKLDWKQLKKDDAQAARLLKEVFPLEE